MAKKYNSNWNAKKLTINFNQKQWRQDFAAYVKDKMFWNITMVSRSVIINSVNPNRKIKQFEVFDNYRRTIVVQFCNNNTIINCTDLEIINEYIKERLQ